MQVFISSIVKSFSFLSGVTIEVVYLLVGRYGMGQPASIGHRLESKNEEEDG